MRRAFIPLLILAITPAVLADDAQDKKNDTRPQITYWVEKLADEEPKVRLQAAEELRKIGKDALPALNQATRNKDPEVATRAAATLKQIEQDAAARPDGIDVLPPPQDNAVAGGRAGGRAGALRLRARPDGIRIEPMPAPGALAPDLQGWAGAAQVFTRNLVVTENGRTVRIQEDNDGIAVTTTENLSGKLVTRVAKAKNLESLKKEHPEAARLYEQYANRMRARIGPLTPQMLTPPARLGQLDLPDAQRQQIEDAFAQAQRAMADHRDLIEKRRQLFKEQLKEAEEIRRQAIEEIYKAQRNADRQP
jgi:hypothetical protein